MPFKSEKQRKFLWSQKPEVAKQIAYAAEGKKITGPLGHFYDRTGATPPKTDKSSPWKLWYQNEGGGINIKPENKGKFTAKAEAKGKGVQEYARQVMANKENYSPATVKQANFARNAAKWHNDGGPISGHAKRQKNWGTRRDKVGEDIAKLADTATDFLPVVGDAKSAKRAYDAVKEGDYGTAALEGAGTAVGWIPFAGPLARGSLRALRNSDLAASAIKGGFDPDYAKLFGDEVLGRAPKPAKSVGASAAYDQPIPRLTGKEEQAAEMLGPQGRRIVADMKREAKMPEVSLDTPNEARKIIRNKAPLSYKGPGAHEMSYRRYKTPDGKWVHATYDPFGNVQNVLGGTGPSLEKGYAKTLGGVQRPSGAFRPITDAMVKAGYPVRKP